MPSRRRRQVELERVLGTPALFATAYGTSAPRSGSESVIASITAPTTALRQPGG